MTLRQTTPTAELMPSIERAQQNLQDIRHALRREIFGQERVIDLALLSLLACGHALFIGVPGLAKTKLVTSLGVVLGLDCKRVQCTPDLLPADIIGSEVLEEQNGQRSFRFVKGPVFTQLLMADEINRASPRTQSALLQAMQEQQVTVAGHDYALPQPFHVLATQNPLEQEGTYPLPEAQLDRFLLHINVGYPERAAEKHMLMHNAQSQLRPLSNASILQEWQQLTQLLPVGDSVLEAILTLVRNARPESSPVQQVQQWVSWGPGPRAAQALLQASRAQALLQGRLSPSVDDVLSLAEPVLAHRMSLSFAARADGVKIADVLQQVALVLR